METRIDTDVAEMMHCGRYEWESNIGSYGGGGKIMWYSMSMCHDSVS